MNQKTIAKIINSASIVLILAGAFGMLFSFPFLWSSRIEDLIGAGFPFIAGAILLGSGVISLATFNKQNN